MESGLQRDHQLSPSIGESTVDFLDLLSTQQVKSTDPIPNEVINPFCYFLPEGMATGELGSLPVNVSVQAQTILHEVLGYLASDRATVISILNPVHGA